MEKKKPKKSTSSQAKKVILPGSFGSNPKDDKWVDWREFEK